MLPLRQQVYQEWLREQALRRHSNLVAKTKVLIPAPESGEDESAD